jgi:pyruvate,water dikinase
VPRGFVVTAAALELPPDQLSDDVAEAAARLGSGRYAVRSSAAAEDLPDASYAGLYETFLDVPADELADKVRRCFSAAAADRVLAYRRDRADVAGAADHGGPPAMAVLVQPMVTATAAGVAFSPRTRSPAPATRPW